MADKTIDIPLSHEQQQRAKLELLLADPEFREQLRQINRQNKIASMIAAGAALIAASAAFIKLTGG